MYSHVQATNQAAQRVSACGGGGPCYDTQGRGGDGPHAPGAVAIGFTSSSSAKWLGDTSSFFTVLRFASGVVGNGAVAGDMKLDGDVVVLVLTYPNDGDEDTHGTLGRGNIGAGGMGVIIGGGPCKYTGVGTGGRPIGVVGSSAGWCKSGADSGGGGGMSVFKTKRPITGADMGMGTLGGSG